MIEPPAEKPAETVRNRTWETHGPRSVAGPLGVCSRLRERAVEMGIRANDQIQRILAGSMVKETYSAEAYFIGDYNHTLFPLTTSRFLVESFSEDLKAFIYKKLLDKKVEGYHFLPQQRCYAAKKGYHLRRTVKLDPVAEFFVYDVVYRNRKSFRSDHRPERRSFGYRFESGKPQSPAAAYGAFKAALAQARSDFPVSLGLDVATYFNSIYHHDLVNLVQDIGWPDEDVQAFGTFMREANVGRSVDCLPHGLHPCKALGAEFLRFLDNDYRIKSDLLLRFLDDIHIFAHSEQILTADMLAIQELLGERGLSLNNSKTIEGEVFDVNASVDEVKASLLQARRYWIVSYDEVEDEEEAGMVEVEEEALSAEQIEYLIGLINSPDVEESDAELVLVLLRDHGDQVLPRMVDVLEKFPGLTKSVYNYSRFATDRNGLDDFVLKFLKNSPLATEYQLFWLAKLAEDFLSESSKYGDIILSAYEHPNSTTISRAKILEIPEKRFGLPQLREEHLRAGHSDWEAWAAAAGTRKDAAAKRNHILSYFANGSQLNNLIADCLKRL